MSGSSAAALAMYRRACISHKRADWRQASHLLAAIVEAQEAAHKAGTVAGADHTPAPVPARPASPLAPDDGARPLSLIEFLCTIGGVRDPGGELAALDVDKNEYARVKRRRDQRGRLIPKLIQPDGMNLETAAERAWCAGFFPEVPDHKQWQDTTDAFIPDGDYLIRAIYRELREESGFDVEPEPVDFGEDDDSLWDARRRDGEAWA